MTTAGRTVRVLALLAVVAAPVASAPTPALAQVDCGRGMSVFSCMALYLGLITASLSMTPEQRRALHADAIQAIRDKWGDNQMMAAREIAQYRYSHNIDVFNQPILGSTAPETLSAAVGGPPDAVFSGLPGSIGAADNDPVELCWGGSVIKRSQCPPRPAP